MRNRGVSEVLGFVLVFSLVTATVGVVYVVGFSGLEDTRDEQRLKNAERAFDVLADNVEDIHKDDAPNRATEIKLYDASLSIGDPERMTVEITNWDGSNPSVSKPVYPVVYEPTNSQTRLVYVGGGVFREDPGGTVIRNRPPITLRETAAGTRTAVIPFIATNPSPGGSVAGKTTVLVRKERVRADVLAEWTDPVTDTGGSSQYDVSYTIETTEERAPAWRDYLNDRFDTEFSTSPCSVTGASNDVVECTFSAERIYVTITGIDVNIEA